jgi:hypothetical protein
MTPRLAPCVPPSRYEVGRARARLRDRRRRIRLGLALATICVVAPMLLDLAQELVAR